MQVSLAVAAENTWSAAFELLGDKHARTNPARALIRATRDDSTVTIQRLAGDKSTVVASLTLSPDCPGKLKQVQEWKKVASAKEIERY